MPIQTMGTSQSAFTNPSTGKLYPAFGGPSVVDYSEGFVPTAPLPKKSIQRTSPLSAVPGPIGTGASAGAMIGGPVGGIVGGVAGAGFGIINALFTYRGKKQQEAENKRVEAANLALLGEAKTERREQTAWERYWKEKQEKDRDELDKYNKAMNFMNALNGQLARRPELGINQINAWNARRR